MLDDGSTVVLPPLPGLAARYIHTHRLHCFLGPNKRTRIIERKVNNSPTIYPSSFVAAVCMWGGATAAEGKVEGRNPRPAMLDDGCTVVPPAPSGLQPAT